MLRSKRAAPAYTTVAPAVIASIISDHFPAPDHRDGGGRLSNNPLGVKLGGGDVSLGVVQSGLRAA